MELIRIKDLEKKYKTGVTAIYDFDLKVKKGDFVFVIGQSGSGKSTLIKLLYREEKETLCIRLMKTTRNYQEAIYSAPLPKR